MIFCSAEINDPPLCLAYYVIHTPAPLQLLGHFLSFWQSLPQPQKYADVSFTTNPYFFLHLETHTHWTQVSWFIAFLLCNSLSSAGAWFAKQLYSFVGFQPYGMSLQPQGRGVLSVIYRAVPLCTRTGLTPFKGQPKQPVYFVAGSVGMGHPCLTLCLSVSSCCWLNSLVQGGGQDCCAFANVLGCSLFISNGCFVHCCYSRSIKI